MTEFNKLVRGRIPQIIEADGKVAVTHVIEDDTTYLHALVEKLGEEWGEFADSLTLINQKEEMADIKEVAKAIVKLLDSVDGVEEIRAKKAEERGDFEQRIFLERTE
jgi:predicted house-cleaning noncanonical NTP pyrophosphatase (MazG superfamily)